MRKLLCVLLLLASYSVFAKPWVEANDHAKLLCDLFAKAELLDELSGQPKDWMSYYQKVEGRTCGSSTLILNDNNYAITRLELNDPDEEVPYDLVVISLTDLKQNLIKVGSSWIARDTKLKLGTTDVIAEDGAVLSTFYGKVIGKEPVATVLGRSPYIHSGVSCVAQGISRIGKGSNFACQAVRGTHLSEGDFKWLNPEEIADGHSMIDWAISFFNTSDIALIGTSYDGFAALAAAINAPEEVKLVIAGSAPTDVMRHSFTAGGILGSGLLNYYYSRENYSELNFEGDLYDDISGYYNIFKELTPDLIDNHFLSHDNDEWNFVVKNYADLESPFWTERGIIDRLGEITAPVYIVGGLKKDQDSLDSYDNFKALEEALGESEDYHLILGNWGHNYSSKIDYMLLDSHFSDGENNFKDRIYIYSQMEEKLKSVERFPALDQKFIEIELSSNEDYMLDRGDEKLYVYDPSKIEYGKNEIGWTTEFILPEASYITGVGTIELELAFSSPSLDFRFFFSVEDGKTEEVSRPFKRYRMRKRIVNNGQKSQKVVIDIPPVMLKLNKGDKIYVGYTHYGPYELLNGHSDKTGIDFFKDFDEAVVRWTTSTNVMGKVYLPLEGTFDSEEIELVNSDT